MVLKWLELLIFKQSRPYDLLSYVHIGLSIVMMMCLVTLCLCTLYAYDPFNLWWIRVMAGTCLVSLIGRALVIVWSEIRGL